MNSFADPETLRYFVERLTPIDYLIIALGSVLVVMQLGIWATTSWKRLHKSANANLITLRRSEIRLQIIAALIELLPYLGILGTVWGLMNALYVIQAQADPTIKVIALRMAPALTSTFLGLFFAIINNFVFNFLAAYVEELVERYRLYYDRVTTATAEVVEPAVRPTTTRRRTSPGASTGGGGAS